MCVLLQVCVERCFQVNVDPAEGCVCVCARVHRGVCADLVAAAGDAVSLQAGADAVGHVEQEHSGARRHTAHKHSLLHLHSAHTQQLQDTLVVGGVCMCVCVCVLVCTVCPGCRSPMWMSGSNAGRSSHPSEPVRVTWVD